MITAVRANNRRRGFEIRAGSRGWFFPYGELRVQPDTGNPVVEVAADAELGCEGFTYRLEDGREDTLHMDAVLEYNEDPAYMRHLLLHRLTIEARSQLAHADVSQREVIRRLGTSASQFSRLMDEGNHTKSFGQLFDLLHVLGCEVEVRVRRRRRRK